LIKMYQCMTVIPIAVLIKDVVLMVSTLKIIMEFALITVMVLIAYNIQQIGTRINPHLMSLVPLTH